MPQTNDPVVVLLYRLMDKHLPVAAVRDAVEEAAYDIHVEKRAAPLRHEGLAQLAEEFTGKLRGG